MNVAKKQSGLTLIEMMIAMVLGLFVTGAIITLFLVTLKANGDDMKMVRLNQEMRAIMTLITRDIRRAGFWGGTTASPLSFEVEWDDGDELDTITFSYDANSNGIDDGVSEDFGYRWTGVGNPIEMLDTAGNWTGLTVNDELNVNGLEFVVGMTTAADGATQIRAVTVTFDANSASDEAIRKELIEVVRLRNEVLKPLTP